MADAYLRDIEQTSMREQAKLQEILTEALQLGDNTNVQFLTLQKQFQQLHTEFVRLDQRIQYFEENMIKTLKKEYEQEIKDFIKQKITKIFQAIDLDDDL